MSCTTRPPRRGEVDGRDYHFVARDEFDRKRDAGDFVEWAEVHGHLYGTLISEVEALAREGRIPVLDIDVQGGVEVIERFGDPGVCSVFVFPPNLRCSSSACVGAGPTTRPLSPAAWPTPAKRSPGRITTAIGS